MKLSAFRVLLALTIVLVATAPLPVLGDNCSWVPNCDEYGQCDYDYVCSPEYYAWQYDEPDWCLYTHGDEVDVQFNQNLQPVAWYVTPKNDPGRDGDYVVVINGSTCSIVAYPW